MKKENLDTREFEFEIRAIDGNDGKMLTGYAAKFNTWSDDLGGFRERIKPGAFKKAIMTSDVRSLYNHNSNMLPLGRTPKTLRLSENTVGLQIENDLPTDESGDLTSFARDLVIAINRGDVSQMSFGFTVAENGDEWTERDGVVSRTIHEVRELFDVSPVVFPAYSKTRVSVRALDMVQQLKDGVATDADPDATVRRNENLFLQVDSILKI